MSTCKTLPRSRSILACSLAAFFGSASEQARIERERGKVLQVLTCVRYPLPEDVSIASLHAMRQVDFIMAEKDFQHWAELWRGGGRAVRVLPFRMDSWAPIGKSVPFSSVQNLGAVLEEVV